MVDVAGGGAGRSQDLDVLVSYAQVLEYLVGYCEPTKAIKLWSGMA